MWKRATNILALDTDLNRCHRLVDHEVYLEWVHQGPVHLH